MLRSPLRHGWLLGLLLLGASVSGCGKLEDPWREARPGQKRVLVSFAPLYCLAQAVAGDDAYVLCLLSTRGPHDYEAPHEDMVKLSRAELILINGLNLDERFMDKLVHGSANRSARVVKLGDELDETLLLHPQEEKEHEHAGHHHHHHGNHDPHVWLGPPQAKAMLGKIAEALAKLDPAHRAGYEQRATAYAGELDRLLAEGKALLAGKKNRRLLTQHESLGYFARAFGLDVVGSLQVQPGQDPDGAQLGVLAEECKKKEVAVIAVEPQYNIRSARTVQDYLQRSGVAVRLVEIDPLETAPLVDGVNPAPDFYLRTMRANLETLAAALP